MPNRPVYNYYKRYDGHLKVIRRSFRINLPRVRRELDANGCVPYCYAQELIRELNEKYGLKKHFALEEQDA